MHIYINYHSEKNLFLVLENYQVRKIVFIVYQNTAVNQKI